MCDDSRIRAASLPADGRHRGADLTAWPCHAVEIAAERRRPVDVVNATVERTFVAEMRLAWRRYFPEVDGFRMTNQNHIPRVGAISHTAFCWCDAAANLIALLDERGGKARAV